MKRTRFSIFTLIVFGCLICVLQTPYAQDSPQWHLPEGATARLGKGSIKTIKFSANGTRLLVASSIGIWHYDTRTGKEIDLIPSPLSLFYAVVFSPDDRTLGVGSPWKASLRDAHTGQFLKSFPEESKDFDDTTGSVFSVSFSRDGGMLASGSGDGTVRLWDVETGRHLQTLEGHTQTVRSVSFSPNSRILASGSDDNTVRLWDVRTGVHLRTLEGHRLGSNSVSFSPDGGILASGGYDKTIRLWDARTGVLRKMLEGPTYSVDSVSFSPDSSMLASVGPDIRLWDVRTGVHLRTLEGHRLGSNSVSFSPDGSMLASGSGDGTVRLWDVRTGEHLRALQGHTNWVSSVSFSPDGDMLASSSEDGTVRLWDVEMGQPLATFEGHTGHIYGVSFSPDGETLASSSPDGTVRLWDTRTGKPKEDGFVPCTATSAPVFSPDGRYLFVADGWFRVVMVELSTFETWETVFQAPSRIEKIAISPDSRLLASGGRDGTILLSDVTSFFSPQSNAQQNAQKTIQLVYLRPSDRTRSQNIDSRLNALIKDVQHFYAAQLHRHNKKTLSFETDENGKAVVHHVDGQFTDTYYQTDTYNKVKKEVSEQFDLSKHVYLVAVDVSNELVNDGGPGHVCGIGGGSWHSSNNEIWQRNAGGLAVIPASGDCFTVGVTAHELGHAFSLEHDFRDDTYLMAYGSQSRLSEDAAEWLSVHPFFNTGQKGFGPGTSFEMRSNRAARLQFQLTDADGLHQVQLLIPTAAGDPAGGLKLHSCQALEGKTDSLVAFNAFGLTGNPEVTLQVIDVHGNITKQVFAVEGGTTSVVSDAPVVSDVPVVSLSPASTSPVGIGEDLELNLTIAGGVGVSGYQATVEFNNAALRYVSSADAEYLPAGAFVVPPIVRGNQIMLGATSLRGSSEGDGTLATLTFEMLTVNPSMPILSDAKLTDSNADFLEVRIENISVSDPVRLAGDVNGDGVVNVADMEAAAARLGQSGEDAADMNNNGVIDAADLLLIAAAIEQGNAAPSLHSETLVEAFTASEVRHWLRLARQQGLTEGLYGRGVLFLEQLLSILTPKETLLLANYPNPFNPETWIPYQLSKSGSVTVSIYAADGRLVRRLWLGHQSAGIYESRSRAVYWDGKNELGEPVASGVYFYTLTAGDFTATRKMLIRK